MYGFEFCRLRKNNVPAEQEITAASVSETKTAEVEISMPSGWTSEDFADFFTVNGKPLTLPTTMNKLMELDEKFTCETVDYIYENSANYTGKGGFGVNILYNDKFLFATFIYSENNDEKAMLDLPMCVVIFDRDFCQKAGIEVGTACGLDYNSTYDDIEKNFGVPNYEEGNYPVQYKFNDEKYVYFLKFDFDDDTQKIDNFNVAVYDLNRFSENNKGE